MKKITTSLTVDAEIVTRARTIIEKSRLPYSLSKLVTALVFEAFDAIENDTRITNGPVFAQFRAAIHGPRKNALYTPDETLSARLAEPAPDEQRLGRLETAIAEIRAQLQKTSIDPAPKTRKPKP